MPPFLYHSPRQELSHKTGIRVDNIRPGTRDHSEIWSNALPWLKEGGGVL
ncbi:uncharacterized protein METZ01_LOCUS80008 [marine metagenome]|uniref:Uncharacterized protein n=1 Tax=marine metagenome TaxID=408172 RepID=A0A381UGN8_9ZZZZ